MVTWECRDAGAWMASRSAASSSLYDDSAINLEELFRVFRTGPELWGWIFSLPRLKVRVTGRFILRRNDLSTVHSFITSGSGGKHQSHFASPTNTSKVPSSSPSATSPRRQRNSVPAASRAAIIVVERSLNFRRALVLIFHADSFKPGIKH